VGLAAAVLKLVAAFFLDFAAAGLGAAVILGSDFWGMAVLLVAVTSGFTEASLTGWEGGFGIEGEGMVALTSRLPRTT
jgi:hypothetical protein